VPPFRLGATYTRDYIHAAVGGSKRSAIPTLDGRVVALCIRTDLNLKAPGEFLCGAGPIMAKAGNLLASTTSKMPVFMKRKVNQWEYRGLFGVAASHRSGARFDAMVVASGRSSSSVSVAIELTA
jgi:hypothetical protein